MTGEKDLDALVAALTLAEKASLCRGSDFWHTTPVERLGVPAVMVADGPHGLRKQPEAADHAGLGGSLPATCFPTAATLGSTWDPELLREVGAAIARECRTEEVAVLLGPGVNIKRSPLCGRNFEYLSEDPYLSGVLATGFVQGAQAQGVGTSLKHFAANNQETDRLRVSADVDERTLREIYLPAFERVVKQARPWTVMCSYNRVNGVYASQHRWLLTTVLREEWGFEGVVVSDWGAVDSRVPALAAGLDLEMPPNLATSDEEIVAAVRAGELDEAVLDTAVRRLLSLVGRASAAGPAAPVDVDASHALARRAASEGAVLLANDGVLPLAPSAGGTLAVIGEFARTPRYQGAGSSQVNPTRLDTALDGLRDGVPAGVEVTFSAGFGLGAEVDDDRLADEAVAAAAAADHVVLFLGLPARAESEGYDRSHLDLPAAQVALLARLAAVHDRIVVVLSNGSAVTLAPWRHHASAVLECWLGGQAGGSAVADLLLGNAAPGGRLAETLPLRLEDCPSFLNFPGDSGHVRYGEGVFVGYRGYDRTGQDVAYPFGHGLTYTTFGYADLDVVVGGRHETGDLALTVSCTLTNAGDRPGKEVVQLYVRDVEASVARPVRELKGFAPVVLDPGESRRVELTLDARDLSFWSPTGHDWVLEAGEVEIAVGASSRDLRLVATVSVDAPPVRRPLGESATLDEWWEDPGGRAAMTAVLGTTEDGRLAGMLGEEETRLIIGNFPMRRLASFPNIDLDHAALAAMVREVAGNATLPVPPPGPARPIR